MTVTTSRWCIPAFSAGFVLVQVSHSGISGGVGDAAAARGADPAGDPPDDEKDQEGCGGSSEEVRDHGVLPSWWRDVATVASWCGGQG